MISLRKRSATEEAVELHLDVVDGVPVEVHVQGAAVGQQVAAQRRPAEQPRQVVVEAPVVAIGVDHVAGVLTCARPRVRRTPCHEPKGGSR